MMNVFEAYRAIFQAQVNNMTATSSQGIIRPIASKPPLAYYQAYYQALLACTWPSPPLQVVDFASSSSRTLVEEGNEDAKSKKSLLEDNQQEEEKTLLNKKKLDEEEEEEEEVVVDVEEHDDEKVTESTLHNECDLDSAACDGPVHFKRVLNPDYQRLRQTSPSPSTSSTSNTTFRCAFCNHEFKSHYCYQKHKRRHLNPFDKDKDLEMVDPKGVNNVQFFPCKICGAKFPSYYFVHKHRKLWHDEAE